MRFCAASPSSTKSTAAATSGAGAPGGNEARPARSIRPGTFEASTTSAEAGRPSPSITEPPFSNQLTVAVTSASTK